LSSYIDMYPEIIHYFAYGSNMHPARLRRRVPSSRALGTATLCGHQLRFHKRGRDGSGKCNVWHTGQDSDRVIGVIYEMQATERYLLDEAEGLGIGYHLQEHTLELNDVVHDVFYYIADSAHIEENQRPFHWYRDLVLYGARFHGLPQEYIETFLLIEAELDADRERAELHIQILEELIGISD